MEDAPKLSKGTATPKPNVGQAPPRTEERPASAVKAFMKQVESEASKLPARSGAEMNFSVRELKEQLSLYSIDFSNCVEKQELQELWQKFELLCQRPLAELQATLAAATSGSVSGKVPPPPSTAEACAAQLLEVMNSGEMHAQTNAPTASAASRAGPTPSVPQQTERAVQVNSQEQDSLESSPCGSSTNTSSAREQEAAAEVRRIESIRRGASTWGFKVLAVESRDLAAVQRGYRALMKKLHPDKVQHSAAVSRALETLKEAKEVCERQLSTQSPPSPPRHFSFTPLCVIPGKRRYRLHWSAPHEHECSPVRRYIVAAFDPAYGKALNVSILEPDYDEELRRFVPVDELKEYVLAEEELQKMPSLWRQDAATMQVAAANDAGQSSWATLKVPLSLSAAASHKSSPSASSRIYEWQGPSTPNARDVEERSFAEELRSRHLDALNSDEFRGWLERQRKPQLIAFVKSMAYPEDGNKNTLIDRVILIMDQERLRKHR
jgi:hypothetical protein